MTRLASLAQAYVRSVLATLTSVSVSDGRGPAPDSAAEIVLESLAVRSASTTRRRFLELISFGSATVAAAGCGGDGSEGGGPVDNVQSLPVGAIAPYAGGPAIVGRDAEGVYAMTVVCTHQGCSVAPSGNVINCPCHGSQYNAFGAVIRGPAGRALVHYAVDVDASGMITVHIGTTVPAAMRTPVA